MPGAVAEEVEQERWERLMAAGQAVRAARFQEKVGRTPQVLIDEADDYDLYVR